MERRDFGYVLAYVFSFLFVAIIGISFSTFLDAKRRIEVSGITVASAEGVLVQKVGEKGDDTISKLDVKSPKVGTKPVSGELDTQTDIPYTVSDQVGSEGAYAKFQVRSETGVKVVLKSVSGVPEGELDNVKIAVDGSEKKPHSLKNIGEVLEEKDPSEKPHKFTVLIWLDQHAGKELIGSKINIELEVVKK